MPLIIRISVEGYGEETAWDNCCGGTGGPAFAGSDSGTLTVKPPDEQVGFFYIIARFIKESGIERSCRRLLDCLWR